MRLSGAHTSAKVQQSPLIQSTTIQNQTQPCNRNPLQLLQWHGAWIGPHLTTTPAPSELTMGQWVMGQQIWVGHGSVPVTRRPMINLTKF